MSITTIHDRQKSGRTALSALLALLLTLTMLPWAALPANAATGDTFTVVNADGVAITYKVLTEDGSTGTVQVGVGGYGKQAIDTGFAGALAVPESVTNGGIAYTVTAIGNNAFQGCASLVPLTLPSTVTSIGESAIAGCTSLTSFTIPSAVTSIGDSAFYYCTGLTSLAIPESVTSIKSYAFYQCTSLTSLTIPASVTSIGGSAFRDCTSLASLTLPASVTSIGGSLFQGCTSLASLTIPSTVTSIGGSAFSGCTNLTSLTLPSTATSIGDSLLQDCTSLTSFTIPESVTSIGSYAFYGCTGLTSLTIPSAVTSIGSCAFQGCTGLTSLTIPSTVTSIGSSAFSRCTGLTSIALFASITSIGNSLFDGCTSLTSFTVPASVTSIGNRTFRNCSALVSLTFLGGSAPTLGTETFLNLPAAGTLYYPEGADGYTADKFQTAKLPTGWQLTASAAEPEPEGIDVAAGYGGGIVWAGGAYTVAPTEANYVIDQVWVDGVEIEAAHGLSSWKAETQPGKSIFATFAYTINFPEPDNGSLSVVRGTTTLSTGDIVRAGEGLSITAMPNEGYELDRLTLTGITDGGDGTYTVTALQGDPTPAIAASFKEARTAVGDSFTAANADGIALTYKVLTEDGAAGTVQVGAGGSSDRAIDAGQAGALVIPASVENEGITYTVTGIGDYAFSGCTAITSLSVPASLTSIGSEAFSGCSLLVSLTFLGDSVPTLGTTAFTNLPATGTVHYPEGAQGYTAAGFQAAGLPSGWQLVASSTEPEPVTLTATTTIIEGGTYLLGATLKDATITIATADPVSIVGNGVGDGGTTGANTGVTIVGPADGMSLTLRDVKIINNGLTVVDCVGGTNTLTFEGISLIEASGAYSDDALVHVPQAAELLVNGSGTVYWYKNSAGAGFGADSRETSGKMTFESLTMFGKTTKQGAGIGLGAETAALTPGDITFNSGTYSLIGNARGALIGGGAGSSGAAAGGNVYINGGTFNLNTDWTGAAIGGGGYAGGNDAGGGKFYYGGGSIRTFVDLNAVSQWTSSGVTDAGVSSAVITADKLSASGTEPVYLLAFDTSQLAVPASSFTVLADGITVYTGGRHGYRYVNEDLPQEAQVDIGNTLGNWAELTDEDRLYLYLTGEDHGLVVNGETFDYVFDEDTQSFGIASTEPPDPGLGVGDTFTATNADGVTITYKVLTTADGAGTVQMGAGGSSTAQAIDSNSAGQLVIPASVKREGVVYTVTGIGDHAVNACKSLTSVIVPASITSIGDYAFSECSSLAALTFLGGSAPTLAANTTFSLLPGEGTVYYPADADGSYTDGRFATAGLPVGWELVSSGSSDPELGVGDAFTATNADGVAITYKVLTATGRVGTVQVGVGGASHSTAPRAIDSSYAGPLVIPATVRYGGGTYTVTGVGEFAVSACTSLTSLTLPGSLTTIGDYAFMHLPSIGSLTIPSSVTSIGREAFFGGDFTSLTIGNSVTIIGRDAFGGCKFLTTLTIPSSVASIGRGAFGGCSKLTTLVFLREGATTIDGFNAETFKGLPAEGILYYPAGAEANYAASKFTAAGLPSGWAFVPNAETPVPEPDGVEKTVGYGGDISWSGVAYTITAAANYVIDQVWVDGEEVENVQGLSLCAVGTPQTESISVTFAYTLGITAPADGSLSVARDGAALVAGDIVRQGEVITITATPAEGFELEALSLTGITDNGDGTWTVTALPGAPTPAIAASFFPVGVDLSVGKTFKARNGDGVLILYKVLSMNGETATVQVGNGNFGSSAVALDTEVLSIPETFEYGTVTCTVTSIARCALFQCRALSSVTIPSSITSIGVQAFYQCTSLTSVTIPASVIGIEGYAFYGCSSLAALTFLGDSAPTLAANNVFAYLPAEGTLYYPDGAQGYTDGRFAAAALPSGWVFTPVGGEGFGEPGSGDIDGDGFVTASDALAVASSVVSGTGLDSGQKAAADIDNDGLLTMADVVLIMRRMLGLL
jgi:hypothetical protein